MTPESQLLDLVREALQEELEKFQAKLIADINRCGHSQPTALPRYLAPEQAAGIAGVRSETVRTWIRKGELPGHQAGRLLRIRLDELEAYLSRGQRDWLGGPDEDSDGARVRSLVGAAVSARNGRP